VSPGVSLLAQPAKVERHAESFWHEAETLASVNHPNVLRFYGVVLNEPAGNVVGIITEYMRGGSLSGLLRRYEAVPGGLPLRERAELALQVVKVLRTQPT
jgi:serine/threonine protein kinase